MSKDLVFYTNPMSRGRLVRWMLEEVGIPYETEIISYGDQMKGADYRAINPMGKVPAIRHGDTVVTECAAICTYLADVVPEAGLAPPPDQRGPYYRWLFFAAGPLESAAIHHSLGFDPDQEAQGRVGYGTFSDVMDTLETALPAQGWIAGDSFTTADLYLGANIGWGLQVGTIENRPGFAAYAKRTSDREAYRRAMAIDDAAMPAQAS
ncbi:MAG TPA: glutathione S-transferase family protein [Kiloniellaceae bacterium]|nr:glutathione S-transferase family protein [Kiloniellaceae bacterium]